MNDHEIIIHILTGNKEHYSVLMEKYHNELFKFVYNLTNNYETTEDLLQEIFLKIYKNLKKYNHEKASFRTWIYRIANNHTINYLKRNKTTYEYNDDITKSKEDIERDVEKEDTINRILKIMSSILKPKQYKIMILHYFSELSVKEISQTLEVPEKTIYSSIKSSIDKIKKRWNLMAEYNRDIDESLMNRSKENTIETVMYRINSKKSFFDFLRVFRFKHAMSTFVFIILVFTVAMTNDLGNPNQDHTEVLGLYESEKIAEVTYMSGSIIARSFAVHAPSLLKLMVADGTNFEQNIEEFNTYFDMLKLFLEDDTFGDDITVKESTNPDFTTEITFEVDLELFIFYVNITGTNIDGILEVNGVPLEVSGEFEQNDKQIDLVMIARNGYDYIEIKYAVESEDEIERNYEIKQYMNGVLSEKEIKVEFGENETKVEIKDGQNEYELKSELEDGELVYKLEYEVNGVEGEVLITVSTDALGNETYSYHIKEDGFEKEIDLDDPDDHDDHEDEEDEEDEEEDDEDEQDT